MNWLIDLIDNKENIKMEIISVMFLIFNQAALKTRLHHIQVFVQEKNGSFLCIYFPPVAELYFHLIIKMRLAFYLLVLIPRSYGHLFSFSFLNITKWLIWLDWLYLLDYQIFCSQYSIIQAIFCLVQRDSSQWCYSCEVEVDYRSVNWWFFYQL